MSPRPRVPASPPSPAPRRVLLGLLLPIGDTLFATPAIAALRRAYPDADLCALVYPTNRGIVRANPHVDRLYELPIERGRPRVREATRLIAGLRAARFDLSVEFGPAAEWLSRLCGIQRRVGLPFPRLWWLLPRFGASARWQATHAVEHYASVVRRLGIHVPPGAAPQLWLTVADRRQAARLLDEHGLGTAPFVALHPGGEGYGGRKRWRPDGFAAVADSLADRHGLAVVLVGGPEEQCLAAAVADQMRTPATVLAGRASLAATAAVLAHATLFVGNDSAPLHLAAAAGTPVVGIYGPTSPTAYTPRPAAVRRAIARQSRPEPFPGGASLESAGGSPTPPPVTGEPPALPASAAASARLVRVAWPASPCFHFVGARPLWQRPRCPRDCPCLATITPEAVIAAAEGLLETVPRRTPQLASPLTR